MENVTVSVNDAAKALGIGRVTLYRHINSGRIDSILLGGRRLVKISSLRQLAATNSAAA